MVACALLDTCLDAPQTPAAATLEEVAGLTPWSAAAPPRQQLRVAGTLQALAEAARRRWCCHRIHG